MVTTTFRGGYDSFNSGTITIGGQVICLKWYLSAFDSTGAFFVDALPIQNAVGNARL
jgi:hypothetical protein